MTDQPTPKPPGYFDPLNLTPGVLGRYTYWILKDRIAYPATNLYEWARWRAEHEHESRIGDDTIDGVGRVSTVFLGTDLNHGLVGPPVLFETMVFLENGHIGGVLRYSLYNEAQAGHSEVLRTIKQEVEAARDLSIDTLVNIMVNNKHGS